MKPWNHLSGLLFFILLLQLSCKKESTTGPAPDNIRIHSFLLKQSDNGFLFGTDTVGTIGSDTIKLVLPGGTKINSLVPTISFTGDSVVPASGTAQDFTQPLKYTVYNKGTLPKYYIVKVSLTDVNQLFINNERVYAIDLTTGLARWINESDWNITIFGNAAVADGLVFAGSSDGKLYGINAISGATQWTQQPAHSYFYSAAVANGIVYAGCGDGNLYAVDAETGMYKWTTPIDSYGLFSTPVVDNGNIYIQCSGNLYGLDASSGAIKWTSSTGADMKGSPILDNSVAYIASNDSNLYAIDITTGNPTWTAKTGPVGTTPALMNGVLYVGCNDDSLYAIDAVTGAKKWTVFVDSGPHSPYISYPGILSSPIAADGKIYIGGGDANFYALDAETGNNLWTSALNNEVIAGPVLINGVLYLGDYSGYVYALDATTGTMKWNIFTGNTVYNLSPAVIAADGSIYNPGH